MRNWKLSFVLVLFSIGISLASHAEVIPDGPEDPGKSDWYGMSQVSLGHAAFSLKDANLGGLSWSGRVAIERKSQAWEIGISYSKISGSSLVALGSPLTMDTSVSTLTLDWLFHLPKYGRSVFIGPVLGIGHASSQIFGQISADGGTPVESTSSTALVLGVNTGCEFHLVAGLSLGPQLRMFYLSTASSITAVDGSVFLRYRF